MPFDRAQAVEALNAGVSGNSARVRLTLDEAGRFACTVVPMAALPARWSYAISPLRVASGDVLARHKISWRELYDGEQVRLQRERGADETIFLNERDEVAEGSRSTVFIRRAGQLLTPPLSAGILDGVLRGALISEGRCAEAMLTRDDLASAEAVFLGNSLRGLIPAVPVEQSALSAAGN